MTDREAGGGPGSLLISDFDYELPPHLIAQRPIPTRDHSRLMVLERETGAIIHATFNRLADWLDPGDLLVANNSRVIPARLKGIRAPGGGAVEILLLRKTGPTWSALGKPAARLRPGTLLQFEPRRPGLPPLAAEVVANEGAGQLQVQFGVTIDAVLDDYGAAPLPPYITEPLAESERYQTVYASVPGSAAAPTAGLHFTPELVAELTRCGIEWTEVTLHVGLDTFRPVTVDRVADHHIHQEWCEVSDETAAAIARCRRRGGRVVAVGTTAARTLETLGQDWHDDDPRGISGLTGAFIVPGHSWRLVDALLTNFHLPKSTLLLLVSALAGRERILAAYQEAVRCEYRFFSFGDAMLIRSSDRGADGVAVNR